MVISPEVVFTVLDDGEAVLLNLTNKRYYSLNPTGTRIWQLLAEGCSPEEIATRLCEEYDTTLAQAQAAVEELLSHLTAEHLIVQSPNGDP